MIGSALISLCLVAAPARTAPAAGGDAKPFSEELLQKRALALAKIPYAPSAARLPESLAKLSYDQYRSIRFRPESSLWRKAALPFEVQLFHLGHLFAEPVSLFIVEGGRATPLRYTADLFDYGSIPFAQPLPSTLGVAGFRVHHPLNRKDTFDELIAFLGASYFRVLGRGNVYGLSARGLAIDTAVASGEVFPLFREFYVETPKKDGRSIVVHALLDSPDVAGAYRFDIAPGEQTEVRVKATLYPRRQVERLGIAPLTSMFLYGESERHAFDDYRPEVHDSDGLLVLFGNGEQLWRPLQNPARLEVSALRAESLKGFGLLQRDRQSNHFEDLEASYELRPSVWVEPQEGFGAGNVFLVEIPSREEIHDNVVAFFTPDQKVIPGTSISFSYRMLWGMSPAPKASVAVAVASRSGSARRIGVPDKEQPVELLARKFVIDFAAPSKPETDEGVEAVVTTSSGAAKNVRVQLHPNLGGYRAAFDFVPSGPEPVELRCFLRQAGSALSETWSYRSSRPRPEGK